MHTEINAALDYLVNLLHSSINIEGFKHQAHKSLNTRFTNIWYPNDSNRASASRVIHWHGHGGGEGQDRCITKACLDNMTATREEEITFFSSPFTLWIDPGCVSIRMGHGPGVYLSPLSSHNIQVIFGRPSIERRISPLALPTVNLVPSTPALNSNVSSWSSTSCDINVKHIPDILACFHNRSSSTCSNSSTFTTTRSISNGSSSFFSSADESEQCPSLTTTSARDSDSEISIEDMIDHGYMNFDIIDDEDEDELHGDDTVGVNEEDDDDDEGDVTISPDHQEGSAAVSSTSIVNYDGGNVGVLGGGIRLGGSNSMTSAKKVPAKMSKSYVSYLGAIENTTAQSLWKSSPDHHPGLRTYSSDFSTGYPSMISSRLALTDGVSKRIRSRGRRSRGRGAGRAARRQAAAAALQATTEFDKINTWSSQPLCYRKDRNGSLDAIDEGIMAIVRQRAEQVSKDIIRRQQEGETRMAASQLNQQQEVYPQFEQQLRHYNNHLMMPSPAISHQYIPIMPQHLNATQQQSTYYTQ